MEGISGFSSKLHIDYELDNKVPNLSESNKLRKISTYGAMLSGVITKGYRPNRHISNPNWFVSEYIRDADAHYELMTLNSSLSANPYTNAIDNIALNKPSFASSEEPSSEKSKANDGSLDTFWGSTPYPQCGKLI